MTFIARAASDHERSNGDLGFRAEGVQIRYKTGPAGEWIPVDWAAFDEAISSLTAVESVQLKFDRDQEGLREYAAAVLDRMPKLSRMGKIRAQEM